jgi:four helix bundle protein
MRNFKKLVVWQNGMALVDKLYLAAKFFPYEEKFGIQSQCLRAGVSIPSNIAEGSAKKSGKDYVRYLEIALGSSFELETQLLIIERRMWFPADVVRDLLNMTIEEQKMISKLIDRIA